MERPRGRDLDLQALVEGPRFVARINVEGDDQADRVAREHSAAFAYHIESYRYWQEQLGLRLEI